MNNRINELFGNALDEAVPETWTTLNVQQLSRLKDKFAELIVRECAYALNPMLRDMISRGQGVHMIYKHFGVEE